jgi:hypothetical protein
MTTGPEKDEPAAAPRCHLCEVGSVTTIPAFERLMRVSSDHLTWARGGRIGVCDRCGGVQKLIYVALPPPWGESLARRLSDDRVRYISPPSL